MSFVTKAIGSLFSGPLGLGILGSSLIESFQTSASSVSTVPTTSADVDAASKAAAADEAARLRKKRGYMSTILTGGAGDISEPNTMAQKLGE